MVAINAFNMRVKQKPKWSERDVKYRETHINIFYHIKKNI